MNWDAIGALGEIIGAAAVFISLLYLAIQIRQSTTLARTQYHTNSVSIFAPFSDWKSANPRVFREGMTDFESLNADDRVNLDSILTLFVLTFKDVLEAHERGFVDRETDLLVVSDPTSGPLCFPMNVSCSYLTGRLQESQAVSRESIGTLSPGIGR